MKLWVDFPFNSIIQCGHLLHLRSSIIHVSAELIKASVPAAYGIYSRLAWFVYVKTDLTQWKLRKSHYPLFSFTFLFTSASTLPTADDLAFSGQIRKWRFLLVVTSPTYESPHHTAATRLRLHQICVCRRSRVNRKIPRLVSYIISHIKYLTLCIISIIFYSRVSTE